MNAGNRQTKDDAASWYHLKWPAIVVVLLAGHIFIVTGALLLSSTWMPGASVVPASYADDLKWDDLQVLQDKSQQLGWSLEVMPTDATELNGDRHVRFVLRNAQGEPIPDAKLAVTIYHHSRPHRPIETFFEPSDDAAGVREAALDIDREGLWHLSATAQHESDRFLVENDFWIGEPTGASQ